MIELPKKIKNCRYGEALSQGNNPRGAWRLARTCIFLSFLFFFLAGFSQKRTSKDSITHFKVKYSNGDYKFFPADGYFFKSSKNKLKIINTKGNKFEVKIVGGTVKKTGGDSLFEFDGFIKTGNALVCIYETDSKGKKKAVLNKPFTVVAYPRAKFGGVPCDSALSALKLAVSSFEVHYTGLKMKVPVTSFKMEFYENGKFTIDSSTNNKLSKKMMAYVEKLKPGSLVYLSDIKYKDPNGNEHTEAVYRAFIIPENKTLKFGVN